MRVNYDTFTAFNQPRDDMCYPTSIKVILDNLGIHHNFPDIKRSLKSIVKLCGWKEGGIEDSDYALSNLNAKHFKKLGYNISEKSGIEASMELIGKILDDGNISMPTVLVSQEYFKEINKGYDAPEYAPKYYHQLVVLDVLDKVVVLFDPFKNYRNSENNDSEFKVEVSIPNFIKYWNGADKSVIYIERVKKEAGLDKRQTKIAKFNKKGEKSV